MERTGAVDEVFRACGDVTKIIGRANDNTIGIKHLLFEFIHVIIERAYRLEQTFITSGAEFNIELS